jgi:DNA-3-methyladenine glycosylase II
MFLIFSLGSSNIFPSGDLGFIKAISKLYKKKLPLNKSYLKRLNNRWSPYCSLATWYLWRSLDPIPISY